MPKRKTRQLTLEPNVASLQESLLAQPPVATVADRYLPLATTGQQGLSLQERKQWKFLNIR